MNYELEVMSSSPTVFNSLTGTQPPLVAGSGSATLMATYENESFEPYNKGYENIGFTLEVWFRPLTSTGEVVVIGHSTEGVLWNGTDFILRVRQDSGVSETTWTPAQNKAFHVAMTYSPGEAQLYVDAEIVATLGLPASPFISASGAIRVHSGTGTGIYDSMALYTRSLPGEEILRHYLLGKSVRSPVQVASANGGNTWTLMHQESDIYATVRFDEDDWSLFFLEGLGMIGDRLTANEGGGVWIGTVPISSMVDGITAGVALNYTGFRVILSWSTDNTTWTPVQNGAVILEDVDTTDKTLFLRVDLPEEGWIDNLSAAILDDRVLSPTSGERGLTFKSTVLDYEAVQPLDYTDSWGAVIRNDGFLQSKKMNGDSPELVGTIEAWIKFDETLTGTNFVVFEARNEETSSSEFIAYGDTGGISMTNGTSLYVDGVQWNAAPLGSYNDGLFHHFVYTLSAPANYTITVVGTSANFWRFDATVGHLATYPKKMTSAEAIALYKSNVGSPTLRIDDASGVAMTEPATPVKIYAEDWSYVSGGTL